MYDLEDPAITGIMLTGYGFDAQPALLCDDCGEEIGEYIYEPENELFLCEQCFAQRVEDYLSLYPRDMADAMSVPWYLNE